MDIDISVVVSPENMQQLVLTTQELDLKPMLPVPLET